MPWTSAIDPDLRLIYTRVSGTLTREDAATHRATLEADPSFDPTFRSVLDLRRVDRVELTTADIVQLAAHSILTAPARQVIVAPSDAIFGVSRMYYAYRYSYRAHEEIDVCRTLSDACQRLGIETVPGADEQP